jgi:hypothetical protein
MRSGSPPTACVGHLLTRPVGRSPNEVRRSFTNFTHPAGTRMRLRRVAAKIEWHWGELYLCVGFMVTNTEGRPLMP